MSFSGLSLKVFLPQVIAALPSIPGAPQPRTPATLVVYLFFFAFALLGVAVGIGFLAGALRYFFSAGNPQARSEGKDRMLRAFLGLAILVSAVLILNLINPDLVRLRDPALVRVELPTSVPVGPGGGLPGGPCTFQAAQWTATVAQPGSTVGLVISGSGCMPAPTVTYRIYRREAPRDELVTTLSGGLGTTWQTPAVSEPAAFYFEASAPGVSALRSSDLMVSPGAVTSAAGCTNPEQGRSAAGLDCRAPCEMTVPPICTRDEIRSAGSRWGVPPALIVAFMTAECSAQTPGFPNCRSRAGSCGIMQIQPSTFRDPVYSECARGLWPPEELSDQQICELLIRNPSLSIQAGTCILSRNQTYAQGRQSQFGYPLSLIQHTAAAYNGGPRALEPSCNCWQSSEPPPAQFCRGQSGGDTRFKCAECGRVVPKWVCGWDAVGGQCVPNDDRALRAGSSYRETRRYAPTVENYYFHFSGCGRW